MVPLTVHIGAALSLFAYRQACPVPATAAATAVPAISVLIPAPSCQPLECGQHHDVWNTHAHPHTGSWLPPGVCPSRHPPGAAQHATLP